MACLAPSNRPPDVVVSSTSCPFVPCRVEIKEPRLDLVFSFLDPENHGKISAESIRSALGEDISAQELLAMIRAGDRDGDNMVSKA